MKKRLFARILIVCFVAILSLSSQESVAGELQIINFSVRSGDAALVILPTGKIMMIDSGTESRFNEHVLPFLSRHGITHLDYWVESHGHKDHSEGADQVMRSNGMIDGSTVEWDKNTFDYEDQFTIEDIDFFIYNVKDTSIYGTDANPNSLAFRMEYNGFVYTTGGDEGTGSMNRFLADHPSLVPAHVRNTPHHLWGPVSVPFMKATDAYFYIVSNSSEIRNYPGYTDFADDFLPTLDWLTNNGGRIGNPGYAITGEVGHIYTCATSGTDWHYSFLGGVSGTSDDIPEDLCSGTGGSGDSGGTGGGGEITDTFSIAEDAFVRQK